MPIQTQFNSLFIWPEVGYMLFHCQLSHSLLYFLLHYTLSLRHSHTGRDRVPEIFCIHPPVLSSFPFLASTSYVLF